MECGLTRGLRRCAYEPHIECGAVVGVVRCGVETSRMECEHSGIAERNVLVYELLLCWQVFNSGHQNNDRTGSLKEVMSDGT